MSDSIIARRIEQLEHAKRLLDQEIDDHFVGVMLIEIPYSDPAFIMERYRMTSVKCESWLNDLGRCVYERKVPRDERLCFFCDEPCGRFDP